MVNYERNYVHDYYCCCCCCYYCSAHYALQAHLIRELKAYYRLIDR